MKILALDSATGACSVALWQDGAVVARRFAAMDRGQSEVLIPMAREVLAEAGADFPSIDMFGVTIGPGAFTGCGSGWPPHGAWRWRPGARSSVSAPSTRSPTACRPEERREAGTGRGRVQARRYFRPIVR